jgi:La domain
MTEAASSHRRVKYSKEDLLQLGTPQPSNGGREAASASPVFMNGTVFEITKVQDGHDKRAKEKRDLEIQRLHAEEETMRCMETMVFMPLARQLEYYLSHQNLSKDTYVQTLRSLNDGCVPVSILANFGRVKAILPPIVGDDLNLLRMQYLVRAVKEHSVLLTVETIDKATGKKVSSTAAGASASTANAVTANAAAAVTATASATATSTDATNGAKANHDKSEIAATASTSPTSKSAGGAPLPQGTLLAIGTRTGEPVELPADFNVVGHDTPVSNTIILRDVPDDVTEDKIREVFKFDGCPPILEAHPDVFHSW